MRPRILAAVAVGMLIAGSAARAATYPAPVEADFVIRNFHFASGETLPELRMHYRTIGTPRRDQSGRVTNAVLLLHGTSGTGANFLEPAFAGQLFEQGQLLDGNTHFIVIPDAIGTGKSSKPSDGLHAKFPHYDYADIVAAQHALLMDKLGVMHLRLLLGTSMGAMQTWMWGETYPEFSDALVALASNPVPVAGRNRVYRKMIIDAIRTDPDYKNGEYAKQPRGLVTAIYLSMIAGSAPLAWQKQYPTGAAADTFVEDQVRAQLATADANDTAYRYDASRNYDPSPKLESITAPLLAINSADDFVNPPELGMMEREIKRVKHGRFVLVPIGAQTRGHQTHSLPMVWKNYLAEFLSATETVAIDGDDIGGAVNGPHGPEAGVWVIAETTGLATKMSKIVVTDEQGRYVIPDLPKATYDVWVRGYGLTDSPKVKSAPGRTINLTAVAAPDARAAAQYYPANYWFALLNIPDRREFPGTGTGANGNGISTTLKSQAQWIANIKTTSCTPCHQIGDKATREIPEAFKSANSIGAWDRRTDSGVDEMFAYLPRFGKQRVLQTLANWTDRIAAGEYPRDAPPRPQGVERNVVITQWDWADPREYFHDSVASDKRNPRVNANGPVYGVHELSSDHISILDPVANATLQVTIPPIDASLSAVPRHKGLPSAYWGDEVYWNSRVITHSNVMDQKGRVWNTSRLRGDANPAFCRAGSTLPSAKLYPLNTASRQYAIYDPKSKTFKSLNTCFSTFHLNFAHDADNTLWSGADGVAGWINTRIWDETGDEQKAQGWAPLIVDTNGNGKQDAWVEPADPVDPAKDKRIDASFYGIAVSPVDGTVWGNTNAFPGAAVHVVPGSNPPYSTLTEIFEVPYGRVPGAGYNPRGMDVDADGVFWTVLASGHYGSFDRRKCKGPLNGPNAATGRQCDEGWTFYPVPGPNFKGNPESAAADSNYYNWVDKYDTFGLGKNIPVATGNLSDSLLFLKDGKWITARVPYPMGFFVKQIDGRIDDPNAGWKGKGLWTASASRATWHLEGGKGTRPKMIKLQLRPNPLAK